MSCNKPPKTLVEQLQILQGRGLAVTDEAQALHCLEHHNYYRISAYRFVLTVPGNPDQFQPGTTFDDLWALYHFDRTLRLLISEAVKRVEISVRARWAYVLGHAHGPQAYEDAAAFRNPQRHHHSLERLDEELDRSDEVFVTHYHQRYQMQRPPIWAVCEVMSFGLLSRFYENIKRDRDKKQIANTYSLSIDNLKSLLEHCVYIRNLCAHHSRLWNRRFTITVQLPQSSPAPVIPNLNPAENRRIYNTLVLLIHMVSVIEPAATWPKRLLQHLVTLKPELLPHMGFPGDWRQRPFWQKLLATP
ncbi:MAG TPA: Abi family protein [Verrucomicrobiae bacterium]|jgi:abortive infection bacteriophage resistance protein